MAHEHLVLSSAGREKVFGGATTLDDALVVTLVPKSRCVLIDKGLGRSLVCNGGVTITEEVELVPDLRDGWSPRHYQLLGGMAAQFQGDARSETGAVV